MVSCISISAKVTGVHYFMESVNVREDQHVKKKLFLKWVLLNIVSGFMVGVALCLGIPLAHGVSAGTEAMAGLIGIVYAVTTVYGGQIAWKVDYASGSSLSHLRHNAKHIKVSAVTLPIMGLCSSVAGMFILLNANAINVSDAESLKKVVAVSLGGISLALIPTMLSMYATYILLWEHHIIEHEIDSKRI